MKRILWFSNCIQSSGANKASGSWLFSMAQLLTSIPDIHLINVTRHKSGNKKDIEHKLIKENFEEYILPHWELDHNGIPSTENCKKIENLCEENNPCLIHVWGVENYFSKIVPQFKTSIPKLLEIQGLHSSCVDVYYGDMSIKDTLRAFGLREILFPFKKSIYSQKKVAKELGEKEINAIKKYNHISTQSRWIRDQIRNINNQAYIYKTGISLRNSFWNTPKWEYPSNGEKNFYCSSAGAVTYKSIQTAIKAIAEVVKIYPETKLYVIGNFTDSNWLKQPGYLTFIKNTVKKLKLSDNVIFTGPKNADGIIDIMHKCIGMIQTSYVESYSLVVAEAQAVGVPSVISFAGAMQELATDRITGLFYSPGDYISCAGKILELIENQELANNISINSRQLATARNSDNKVLDTQLQIYNQILQNNE